MKLLKLVASAVALCAVFSVQARTLDEIKKDGKILIATEGQFAPFNFFNGTTLTGFEVDLAELVAKKMGVTIQWKTLGFDALLTGLRQDRWDLVIASHGITDERAKAVTFTEPHYCSGGVIIAKDAGIRSAGDLAGKVVASLRPVHAGVGEAGADGVTLSALYCSVVKMRRLQPCARTAPEREFAAFVRHQNLPGQQRIAQLHT